MARTKQTGPELKLYELDTMIYLSPKNVFTKLSMLSEFVRLGGKYVADANSINRAKALERFDKNFRIEDITFLTNIEGQANETWFRKNGLIDTINGNYTTSIIAKSLINGAINISDYCFLLLSKQWVKVKLLNPSKDIYNCNLLALIFSELLSNPTIKTENFVEHINNKALSKYQYIYEGLSLSNQEAARFLIEPLLACKIISIDVNNYIFNKEYSQLATDYVRKESLIRKVNQVGCIEESYWNCFSYGVYDIIEENNIDLYKKYFPNLLNMKGKTITNDNIDSHFLKDENGNPLPHLQITYGAPGTGKSFGIEEDIQKYGMRDIRTTFHPDSDYSTFVGAYKPQMEHVDIIGPQGIPTGKKEKRIVYKFTKQAFLKAYIAAWKDLSHPYVLVIEELNRGNCAQIFGDLFQLLDYNDGNFSKYPISADADIEMVLCQEFENLQIENAEAIDALYKEPVTAKVKTGEILILPNNLYIWATMNTSDQSLFPIDSAFKRRWGWKYIPIRNAEKGWKISVNGQEYDWWSFLEEINKKIWDATHSEDKKLGYFFCKADRKANLTDDECSIISVDRFVGKVLFYVYNDVFKDYGFDDDIFKDENDNEDPELQFQTLFMPSGKTNEKKVQVFLDNLKVNKSSSIVGESNNNKQEARLEQTDETETQNQSVPSTLQI